MKINNHVVMNDGHIHAFVMPIGFIQMENVPIKYFWGFMWYVPLECPHCHRQEMMN